MDFFELVKKRHSVRNFSDKKVSKEKIQQILNAAKTTPSAGNLKAYDIIVVYNDKIKQQLASNAGGQQFVAEAPVVLVFCALPKKSANEYGERGRFLYSIQDATIVCSYAQLAIADLGLGSCWVGAFQEQAVRLLLKLTDDYLPVALLPIGYEK